MLALYNAFSNIPKVCFIQFFNIYFLLFSPFNHFEFIGEYMAVWLTRTIFLGSLNHMWLDIYLVRILKTFLIETPIQ